MTSSDGTPNTSRKNGIGNTPSTCATSAPNETKAQATRLQRNACSIRFEFAATGVAVIPSLSCACRGRARRRRTACSAQKCFLKSRSQQIHQPRGSKRKRYGKKPQYHFQHRIAVCLKVVKEPGAPVCMGIHLDLGEESESQPGYRGGTAYGNEVMGQISQMIARCSFLPQL